MKHSVFLRRLPEDPSWGGFENQMLHYFERIDYTKNEITLVLSEDTFSERLKQRGLPVRVLQLPERREGKAHMGFFEMYKYLKAFKPDSVVYAQGAFTDFCLEEFAAGFFLTMGNIFALEVLGAPRPDERSSKRHFKVIPGLSLWWHWRRFRFMLQGRLCKAIITVGDDVKKRLVEWYRYPPKKTHISYHGIDYKKFSPDAQVRETLRQRLSIPEDKTVIISTARLSKEKCLDRLINAYDKICVKFPESLLVLVGNGPLENDLKDLVINKKSKDSIIFAGFQEDVASWLKMSDIFVLPSDIEGLSNAMLEAMSTGLVAVVTEVPGAGEVVTHQENGFLAHPSEEGVMKGLEEALSLSQEKREEIKKNGRSFVAENFYVEKGVRKALNILGIKSIKMEH